MRHIQEDKTASSQKLFIDNFIEENEEDAEDYRNEGRDRDREEDDEEIKSNSFIKEALTMEGTGVRNSLLFPQNLYQNNSIINFA